MNQTATDTQERETTEERTDTPRREGPFGGLSPAEAGRRGAVTRREKKAEREAAAELDRLALSGRVSTALAAKLPYSRLERIVDVLADNAEKGSVQAARELRSWLDRGAVDAGAQDGDAVPWGEMSAEQRAAARAQLQRELAEIEEGAA